VVSPTYSMVLLIRLLSDRVCCWLGKGVDAIEGGAHRGGCRFALYLRGRSDLEQSLSGSLYPALQRLESRGWIKAEWGTSDNNRKARFYELTKAGRKQLTAETQQWRRP
jgi:hypothetical protein